MKRVRIILLAMCWSLIVIGCSVAQDSSEIKTAKTTPQAVSADASSRVKSGQVCHNLDLDANNKAIVRSWSEGSSDIVHFTDRNGRSLCLAHSGHEGGCLSSEIVISCNFTGSNGLWSGRGMNANTIVDVYDIGFLGPLRVCSTPLR